MAFLNDTFTDVGGTLLSAHTGEAGATWTKHSAASSNAQIAGNRARVTSGGNAVGLYYASGTPATAEYDVQALVYRASSSGTFSGIAGRIDTASNTLYLARYNGTDWQLLKIVAGTVTTLATFAQALTVGQTYDVKLEIRDALKKVFVDGVEVISSTDNAITAAGRAGVRLADTTASDTTGTQIESITASDPGPPPPPPPSPEIQLLDQIDALLLQLRALLP